MNEIAVFTGSLTIYWSAIIIAVGLLAALAACTVSHTASATDGRYREYVVGERAGGMGGAAIAVASDVDAIYYNPAGLAHSQGDSISLSANLYGRERITVLLEDGSRVEAWVYVMNTIPPQARVIASGDWKNRE